MGPYHPVDIVFYMLLFYSYHIVSCHIIPYHIIYHITPYVTSHITSQHHITYHIIYHITHYIIYHITLSCHISYRITSHHTTPHHITSHQITSHHITSYHHIISYKPERYENVQIFGKENKENPSRILHPNYDEMVRYIIFVRTINLGKLWLCGKKHIQ